MLTPLSPYYCIDLLLEQPAAISLLKWHSWTPRLCIIIIMLYDSLLQQWACFYSSAFTSSSTCVKYERTISHIFVFSQFCIAWQDIAELTLKEKWQGKWLCEIMTMRRSSRQGSGSGTYSPLEPWKLNCMWARNLLPRSTLCLGESRLPITTPYQHPYNMSQISLFMKLCMANV